MIQLFKQLFSHAFSQKNANFFSKIFKKLQILAKFFTTLLKMIFRNCENIKSYALHDEKT